MPHIAIISSSVRKGRQSHRVALFFQKFLLDNHLASCEIIDLFEYSFPIFDERLKHQANPTPQMLDFAGRINGADGVLVVTPEYNGGYPPALKNVIDLLYDEWYKKPVALAAVSDGDFGGTQVITSLSFTFWKMHAWVVPARFHVQKVQEAFDEEGNPTDEKPMLKRTKKFVEELMWCVEAKRRMGDGRFG